MGHFDAAGTDRDQWRNDRPCYPRYAGGGKLPNLLFFKRKIVRLGSKMHHIHGSARAPPPPPPYNSKGPSLAKILLKRPP